MVEHKDFSAVVRKHALEQINQAMNESRSTSPERLSQILADVAVFAVEEYMRQQEV